MATKAQFDRRCKELGVTVEDNGYCLSIDAPRGKMFGTGDCHGYTLFYYDGWTKPQMYDEFLHDMSMGLRDCDDPECEICNE
jgi:hypothetical protein